ncbi:amidoligase family protein [Sinanaerobacter sp. ZZT-01]|uniref:amidoligase family protein n=1 Tax=Sinanaerobacter sp. ZZT-01 TaxID=3111540 RepID=UPI002D77DCA6|nr:amidoligase family protein [Sinanaerobacter sp. ZZT-01]WRR94165.1 amidoligase family protein [Sinanaerobacter sp. ZZT-01]
MENRLDGLEVDVTMESRTRGLENVHVSFLGSGTNVRSGSGNTYHVDIDSGSCTCPDHQHRHTRCRHIEAVEIAQGQVSQGIVTGNLQNEAISPNQVIGEYMAHEQQSEINICQQQHQDDAFFYNDNPEQFRQDMERLAREPIPYYRENVLNGSDVTFGVELEFINGDSNPIAAELYQRGICSSRRMQRYHSQSNPGKWKVERDGSVTSGRFGGEIISPILQDTPETWKQIETICEVAKRHGAQVNYKTGGHVHIGAEHTLDGKRQRWRRFFKMAAGFEEVYFKLSGGEQGRFRGGGYAPSSREQNRDGITTRMPQGGETHIFQNVMDQISRGRYQSVNIRPFRAKKTIEFRAFNGTLNPGIIQANIKYAAGLINSAERSRIQLSENFEVTAEDRKRGEIINQYEQNSGQSDQAIMNVLDTVCSRKQDKEHLLSVLVRNEWFNR